MRRSRGGEEAKARGPASIGLLAEAPEPLQGNLCPPDVSLGASRLPTPGLAGRLQLVGEARADWGPAPCPTLPALPEVVSPKGHLQPLPPGCPSGRGSQGPPVTQGVTGLQKGSCRVLTPFLWNFIKAGVQTPEPGLGRGLCQPQSHPPRACLVPSSHRERVFLRTWPFQETLVLLPAWSLEYLAALPGPLCPAPDSVNAPWPTARGCRAQSPHGAPTAQLWGASASRSLLEEARPATQPL